MTLYEAVDRAASDLPPKWTIEICIEQGAACVYLYDPSYNDVGQDSIEPSDGLADQVMKATSIARSQA